MKIFLAFLLSGSCAWAFAGDSLIIVSPHRKSIQQEFVPAFKEHYKKNFKTDVDVKWIDQGGTSDDLRFVKSKFSAKPQSAGIDIFWGGGTAAFVELNLDGLLTKYELPKDLKMQIPADAAGVPLSDKGQTWYASALSSFGIFYNKKALKLEGLQEPQKWADLAEPNYRELVSMTDPRRSGSYALMTQIVLESEGWEKGWQKLSAISGNVRAFTHSSSDPIKAVVTGDASAAMAIDFYAAAKIADLGKDNLGFVVPEGQTVLDPDPIALLKGAPNQKAAERFIDFVLSSSAQKLLVLPQGVKDGPKLSFLGRMSVNKKTYEETEGKRIVQTNPFQQKPYLKMDMEYIGKTGRVVKDLFGAIVVDVHHDLKSAWAALVKAKNKEKLLIDFGKVPLTEKELLAEEKKWDDDVYRNKKINEWVAFARKKFADVKKSALSH